VGPLGIYLLFGGKNVKMIFRNSKVLSKDASSQMIFHASGMSKSDSKILASDKSGVGAVPLTETPEEKRIWKRTHEWGISHLANGSSVNMLTLRFMDEFVQQLDREPLGQQFTTRLGDFFKNAMFRASTTSLVGSEIFNLNPDLEDIYWNYEGTFLLMAIGMPRFLYYKGHVARDRMLNASKNWIKAAWKNFDQRDSDSDWEKHFGSAFIRGQAFALQDAGISHDGQAAAMLPLIWA
jgi:hypothetical protein